MQPETPNRTVGSRGLTWNSMAEIRCVPAIVNTKPQHKPIVLTTIADCIMCTISCDGGAPSAWRTAISRV
jgi:hypothetical protein